MPIIRFHDLRHSSASIMLALGLSLFTVQKTLGQASLQMLSRRYGHIVPELAAAELEKLEDAFVNFEQGSAWRLQAQLPTRDHLTPTYSWCATA